MNFGKSGGGNHLYSFDLTVEEALDGGDYILEESFRVLLDERDHLVALKI